MFDGTDNATSCYVQSYMVCNLSLVAKTSNVYQTKGDNLLQKVTPCTI